MGNVTKFPLYKQAVQDFIAEFKYGDMVSHAWLEEHFGMPTVAETEQMTAEQFRERQFEWLANVEAFKAELLKEHQACLQSVRGQGYRWVPPHEQTDVAVTEFQRGAKKIFTAAGSKLRNLRVFELTDEQRRANMDAVAKFSALQGMAQRALK
ncbi:TPA: hypothetical protein ACKR4O_004845 [Pseudomonas aeruginosa]|nr:hypothetical protein [Pseudomonas aeruginosa]HCF3570061.1 hypothetical protein [Pseudomonas aeruginosa]HEJ3473895.1 hypothetical protein [Pseudomonas aeruginosa]